MFDTVRTAATTAAQNLRQAAKDLGKRPAAAPAPGDATPPAGGAAYQADRWVGPTLPREPKVVPKEPRLPFIEPGTKGREGDRLNALNERLERLYEKQTQLGDQLAQARIKAQGSDDSQAKMAVKLLEARKAMIDMTVTRLEEQRTELMDRWSWAHNE